MNSRRRSEEVESSKALHSGLGVGVGSRVGVAVGVGTAVGRPVGIGAGVAVGVDRGDSSATLGAAVATPVGVAEAVDTRLGSGMAVVVGIEADGERTMVDVEVGVAKAEIADGSAAAGCESPSSSPQTESNTAAMKHSTPA